MNNSVEIHFYSSFSFKPVASNCTEISTTNDNNRIDSFFFSWGGRLSYENQDIICLERLLCSLWGIEFGTGKYYSVNDEGQFNYLLIASHIFQLSLAKMWDSNIPLLV